MAEREDPEKASGEPAATPNDAPKTTEPTPTDAKNELPAVESPSISPAAPEPVVEPRLDRAIPLESDSPIAPGPTARSGVALGARGKRNALLAASVALAAALGAVVGALASGGFANSASAPADVAGLQERKAMQQSIAHLSKEIATLKASVEAANKSSHSQIAKISERFARERAEITGSISAPRTLPPASAAAPAPTPAAQTAAPMPGPRLPRRLAAIETPSTRHLPVVPGWSLRMVRDGYALVEGHGDIYQVVPGVPVPGLGLIEQIKREDGRWVVVTARGIVVSMRDRRYFEAF